MVDPKVLANALKTDPEAHSALYDLAYNLAHATNADHENLIWECCTDRLAYLITKNRRQVLLEQDRPVTSEKEEKVNLKKMLYQKGIKQVDLVKQLGVDPGRISLQINGVRPLPEKYQKMLAKILQVSLEEIMAICGMGVHHEQAPSKMIPEDML